MHHLGTFEGQRLGRSRGYREPCSIGRAVASFLTVLAIVFIAGVTLGVF